MKTILSQVDIPQSPQPETFWLSTMQSLFVCMFVGACIWTGLIWVIRTAFQ